MKVLDFGRLIIPNKNFPVYESQLPGSPSYGSGTRQRVGREIIEKLGRKKWVSPDADFGRRSLDDDLNSPHAWLGQEIRKIFYAGGGPMSYTWEMNIFADSSGRYFQGDVRYLGNIVVRPICLGSDAISGYCLTLYDDTQMTRTSTRIVGENFPEAANINDPSNITVQLPTYKGQPLLELSAGALAVPVEVKDYIYLANPPNLLFKRMTLSFTPHLSPRVFDIVRTGISKGDLVDNKRNPFGLW